MYKRLLVLVLVVVVLVLVVVCWRAEVPAAPAAADQSSVGAQLRAAPGEAGTLLGRLGVTRGICVLLGDTQCRLARELARNSQLTLCVQLPGAEEVEAAARAADEAGLYGTRIYVQEGTSAQIGLGDDLADAVVLAADWPSPPKAEVLRVLRPGGKAIQGEKQWIKPFPEGMDDWSHHYHGPDNNPQSLDRLARAPYLTQFIAEPRYAPAPQAAVASAGRVFMAFGHVAWHQREEPWLNTLVAVNGFNGTMLWKRPLTPGIMVDRSTMIATPTTLYLADEKSCKLIDPATGKLRGEIAPPVELTGGTFWKWMALEDGVLYALVGQAENPDPVARWRSERHGWPWDGISQGYNARDYHWGFAKTLLAIDPRTKKVLWHHQEDPPIDSRSLCMKDGRIYFCSFGRYLACLSAETGRPIWKRTAEKDPEVFRAIGPYRPGHGYIGGWKSTVYMKCTRKALYVVGPQVEWLTALSADDGHVLFRHLAKDLHIVIRDDGLYTIGAENTQNDTQKLDPLTGQILASYRTHRRACTRSTGSADGILFRASGGSGRLDTASGKMQWISAMRPSCHVGVVIANGHLYWVPWVCDCNLQMFGMICCGPAGQFVFDEKAADRQRLETPAGVPASPAAFDQSADDWPTYRADNSRTARTRAAVPEKVDLLWQSAPTVEVEPTAPVAAGGMVFVGSSNGVVRALDAATGRARWTAYVGGSVRFPPAVAQGRALVGSDDGWVYALEAATGRRLWRFRAAPAERKIPVYGALKSTWPVASGVLVDRGTAYFAAGINDFDGTHVYAVDAATGKIRWQNNTSGHLDASSRRGVACQGEMLLADGRLYLAGGNAVSPAVFDLATGRCLNDPPRGMGTSAPRGRELWLVGATGSLPAGGARVAVSGQPLYSRPEAQVFDPSTRWQNPIVAAQNAELACVVRKTDQGPGWLVAARRPKDHTALWSRPLPAEPVRWAVAVDTQGRVIVSLRNGQVLCFGPKPAAAG
jgi:outer membrane protein assembly factor BamB